MTALARFDAADRIADLEAEVEWLRAELGMRDDRAAAIRESLGLTPAQGVLVATLYAVRGRWVDKAYLDERLPGRRGASRIYNAVEVHVCNIRKRLGAGVIETSERASLRLSAVGLRMVDICLRPTAQYVLHISPAQPSAHDPRI